MLITAEKYLGCEGMEGAEFERVLGEVVAVDGMQEDLG